MSSSILVFVTLSLFAASFADEYVATIARSSNMDEAHNQLQRLLDIGVSGIEIEKGTVDESGNMKDINSGSHYEVYGPKEFMDHLSKNGIKFSYSLNPSQEIHRNEMQKKAELESRQRRQERAWNPNVYHHYDDLQNFIDQMVFQYPTFTRKFSIGTSAAGRELVGIRITKNPDENENEPEFKYIGNMHGDETVGRETLIQLIYLMCTSYNGNGQHSQQITRLIDSTDIYIVPSMNPDGFELGRRSNTNYLDLNRNFPDLRFPGRTVGSPQPESLAIMNFTSNRYFTLSANFHGGSVVANYPWDGNQGRQSGKYTGTDDDDVFRHISLTYSEAHTTMHLGTEFANGITNGADWYVLYGGMQDWNYIMCGTMEITLELSDTKYPSSSQLGMFWDQNRNAMLAYMEQVHTGFKGTVTNAQGTPLAATVKVQGRDHTSRTDPEHGDYYRLTRPGTYTVTASAKGYKDQTIVVNVPASAGTPYGAVVSNFVLQAN